MPVKILKALVLLFCLFQHAVHDTKQIRHKFLRQSKMFIKILRVFAPLRSPRLFTYFRKINRCVFQNRP